MTVKRVSLLKLELCNFNRFYGVNAIDLRSRPEEGKPIVLIGALNGRGKTTIFEAVNYALFEPEELPGYQSRPTYLKRVNEHFNRQAKKEGSKDFWVATELLLSGNHPERRIRIERRWQINARTGEVDWADLKISEDGRPLDFDDSNGHAYADFLSDIIPAQVSQFFFFDGEDIAKFADDDGQGKALAEAIEAILHIKVYKNLKQDIKKFVIDYLEANEIKDTGEIFDLQKQDHLKETELVKLKNRLVEIKSEREELERALRRISEEIHRLGGKADSSQRDLGAERQRLETELGDTRQELNTCFESLPILLAGSLRDALRRQLESENSDIVTAAQAAALMGKLQEIKRRVLVDPDPPPPKEFELDELRISYFSDLFERVASHVLGFGEDNLHSRLHDVSEADRDSILRSIDNVRRIGNHLRDAINRREKLTSEMRNITLQMQAMSNDPNLSGLLEEHKTTSEKLGDLDREEREANARIGRLNDERAELNRRIEQLQRERVATNRAEKAVQIARHVILTLDEFIKRLSPNKLRLLQRYMTEMYFQLAPKENPIATIDVNPDTWSIILKDMDGGVREKAGLSAGMKEIYALSLLWALSRASGKQLPVIIDFPGGRLDSYNLSSVFEKYLPQAGHQVIVLSTDKEIDVEWARRLNPHTAKQYLIEADREVKDGAVRVVEGYFL